MIKLLLTILLIVSGPSAFAQQVQVTRDTLPDTNSPDSTAVLNNNLRLNQNAINSIGGYFNANQALTEANGGTGTNLSATPNGSILIQDGANVGIGTFGQGTSGQIIVSNGAGLFPSWQGIPARIQVFTNSGSFTAPSGVTNVYVSLAGGGGGGGGGRQTGSQGGGGGGGAQVCINVPYTVVPGNSYTVNIGAGGTAGLAGAGGGGGGTSGGNGGGTSFDALTVVGGNGGSNNSTGTAAGGAISGLSLTASAGSGGGFGFQGGAGGSSVTSSTGGGGGGTVLSAGPAGATVNNAGNNGSLGAGGSGAGGANVGATNNGGLGGSGICIVQY